MTIKYPNGKTYEEVVKDEKKEGIIKRKRNGLADRANMGMHLENDVIKSCDYYRNLGIASIYKRPTPIRVYKVDKSNPNKIIEAHFDQKSTTDFVGVYRSKYIDFECKETKEDTLHFQNIRPQQVTHLDLVLKLGGIGFFVVSFTQRNEVYLLDAHFIVDRILKEKSHQGFKRNFFIENGILIKQGFTPRLYILDAIDKAYFNSQLDPDNPKI